MAKQISEVFNNGDVVEAQVISIDASRQRMSLGLKQLKEDPWDSIEDLLAIGQTVKGKLYEINNLGAFLRLENDLLGIIPNSALQKRSGFDSDNLSSGQEMSACIQKFNQGARHVVLELV